MFRELSKKSMKTCRDIWQLSKSDLYDPPETIQIDLWPFFNQMTGGLRMNEFTIICGATGTGKTSLLANISANLICQKVNHFVASVETGDADFVRRVASVLLNKEINDGSFFSRNEVEEFEKSLGDLILNEHLFLSLIDNRMPLEFLLASLQEASETHNCKVALLDNLNFFLEVKCQNDMIVEMDRVVHELIMFCKKTNMHVFMIMHPKKTFNGRVESEFDIKGSSTAVQEAHNVFLFNRTSDELREKLNLSPHCRELKAVKLRKRGRYVGRTLIFSGETSSYSEIELA